MVVRQPRLGFDRHGTNDQWPALVASTGLTAALFAAALGAMHALPKWSDSSPPESATRAVVVQFRALPMPVPPRATTPRIPRLAVADQRAPTAVPVGVPASVPPPAAGAAPAMPAAPIPGAPGDSGVSTRSLLDPERPASRNAIVAPPAGRGAPVAPAGVTIHNAPVPASVLDSVAQAKLAETAELASMRAAARDDKQKLDESLRQSALLRRRVTSGGNTRDVVVMQGQGVDGVGAVGGAGSGMASVSAPLFSSGPSAAQRRKNEEIDADYQLRLRRLEDRVLSVKAAARADSLRRDSLERKRRPRS